MLKRMAIAFFWAFVTVILVVPALFSLRVRAVEYSPGVKAGDWIKYGQYSVTWTGKGTEPTDITRQKKIVWLRVDVEYVSGTTVTLNVTAHLNNGTQTSVNVGVDVMGNATMVGTPFLIASNLKKGDQIINQTSLTWMNQITTTTTGRYAGAWRNVDLAEHAEVYGNITAQAKIYWDQSTGFLVEIHSKYSPDPSNPNAIAEFSLKATETNIWSPDLLGSLSTEQVYIIAGIIVVIVAIAMFLALRRRKQSPPPPPPPPLPTQTTQTPNQVSWVARSPLNGLWSLN